MKGYLVRIGIDTTYGQWNAPVDPKTNRFLYVPIPENHTFRDGLWTRYIDLIPHLNAFAQSYNLNLHNNLNFPNKLLSANTHLDPDFRYLTYGDVGTRRGAGISKLNAGDILAFYSGLKPIEKNSDNLIYALVGLYVIDKVYWSSEIPEDRYYENAHTRKIEINEEDIVIKAKPEISGRLKTCIPIGEWLNRAYRVRKELLRDWGGLSVKDGYIQRSIVPPSFLNPEKFYLWFTRQEPILLAKNNP